MATNESRGMDTTGSQPFSDSSKSSSGLRQTSINLRKEKAKIKELEEYRAKLEAELRKKYLNDIKKAETEADKKRIRENLELELDSIEFEFEERKKRVKELSEELNNGLKDSLNSDSISNFINSAIASGVSNLRSTVDSITNSYIEARDKMAYNLNGYNRSINEITDHLTNSLTLVNTVNHQNVFNKLTEMVGEGILYNVEQRAFLQSLADDLGMMFNATDGTLTRLINIQQKDLSANRMAIEASLKEFLNQNYKTSQYIKDGFVGVSNSLIEAQSLMTTTTGMQMEATVQKWLGSMSSAGMSENTVQQLAQAIGYLGSGNISALNNNNMQRLLVLGAAQQNLDYGNLLNEGLTYRTVDKLMSGIVDYIAQMGEGATNVIKSEYARIFGINVSDIAAAANIREATRTELLNTDINNLLNDVGGYISATHQINNLISNMLFGAGSEIASSLPRYALYKGSSLLSDMIASAIGETTISTPSILGALPGINIEVGSLIRAVPLLTAFDIGDFFGGLSASIDNLTGLLMGNSFEVSAFNRLAEPTTYEDKNTASTPDIKSLLTGAFDGVKDMLGNATTSITEASKSTYDKVTSVIGGLAESISSIGKPKEAEEGPKQFKLSGVAGNLAEYLRNSGQNVSGSMVFNADSSDMIKSVRTSAMDLAKETMLADEENYGPNEIYALMLDIKDEIHELPAQPFITYTRIAESANTVTIGNDLTYLQDMVTLSAINLQNIYLLLLSMSTGDSAYANEGSIDTSNWEWANPLDWLVDVSQFAGGGDELATEF